MLPSISFIAAEICLRPPHIPHPPPTMPPTFPHHHAFSHPHARPGRETSPAAPPKLAIVGTFIDTHTQDGTQLRVRHDSVVVVDTGTGRIESILPHAISPPCPTSMEIVDLRGDKCSVFVPGFVDCVPASITIAEDQWTLMPPLPAYTVFPSALLARHTDGC